MFFLRTLTSITLISILFSTVSYASIRGEVEHIAGLHGLPVSPSTADLLHHFSRNVQKATILKGSYAEGFVRKDKNGRRSFHFDLIESAFVDDLNFAELAFTDYDTNVLNLQVRSSPLLKIFFKDQSHCEFILSSIDSKKLAAVEELFSPGAIEILFPFTPTLQVASLSKQTLISHNTLGLFNLLGSLLAVSDVFAPPFQFRLIRMNSNDPKDYPFPPQVQTLKEKLLFCAAQVELLEITAPMRNISPGSIDLDMDAAKTCYKFLQESWNSSFEDQEEH